MPWVEIFVVLLVAHLLGDFVLQTEWQALNKFGGLGGDAVKRRALLMHIATYAIPFIPVFIWIAGEQPAGAVAGCAAVVFGTHLIQDDGHLLDVYIRRVKKTAKAPHGSPLWVAIDQSCHVAFLFGAALVAAA